MGSPTFIFGLISVFIIAVNCLPAQVTEVSCEYSPGLRRSPCGYTGKDEAVCVNTGCCFDSSYSDPCTLPVSIYFREKGHSGHIKMNQKSGFKGEISEHGVRFGADATVFEAGKRTDVGVDGLHWVGYGYTVGLSVTTEAKVGLKETGFKLAGTGMSIGSEKGVEFCFFGSCVSIG